MQKGELGVSADLVVYLDDAEIEQFKNPTDISSGPKRDSEQIIQTEVFLVRQFIALQCTMSKL